MYLICNFPPPFFGMYRNHQFFIQQWLESLRRFFTFITQLHLLLHRSFVSLHHFYLMYRCIRDTYIESHLIFLNLYVQFQTLFILNTQWRRITFYNVSNLNNFFKSSISNSAAIAVIRFTNEIFSQLLFHYFCIACI